MSSDWAIYPSVLPPAFLNPVLIMMISYSPSSVVPTIALPISTSSPLALRADGSSKFGPNSKWGYFPAVSGAWRVCEEDFIQSLNLFSDLKLRVGYGMAGNNRIGELWSVRYSRIGYLPYW